jgi:hypothetical protein
MMAEFLAALTPPRTAREPPVKKPAMTAEKKSVRTGDSKCAGSRHVE